MKVSVVVPSYRRPEDLKRCLAALHGQDRPPDEVLVVHRPDDALTAATVAQAESPRVRGVVVERPGVLAAMDAGVKASAGDVVAFTDDDAAPRSDWLRRVEANLAADQRIAAVGGRDWCWYGTRLVVEGHHKRVGRVQWFGRLTSGHHAGDGPAQDVQVLKGCNMAFRREVLAEVGFDPRMRGHGAQTHYELSLCLQTLRRGWTLRYDPAVAVDHYPAPRHGLDQRERPAWEAVEDSVHNETLALLEHLGPVRRVAFGLWAISIGTSSSPGVAHAIRRRLAGDERSRGFLGAVIRGRRAGLQTFLASRRSASARVRARIAVVVHSPSGVDRAAQLFDDEPARIVVGGSSTRSLGRVVTAVAGQGIEAVYLIDVGNSTVLAAVVARALRRRVVIDTGDLGFELARSVGRRGRLGIAKVWLGEHLAMRLAHHVVVRGAAHVAHLGGKDATVVRDLPPAGAMPRDGTGLRRELGYDSCFVVGLVGSLNRAPRLGVGYGWDLVEALALCEPAVVALIVGDGAGRPILEARARELGVSDRLRFLGRLEAGEAVDAIAAMDMAISTQTNDLVGAVRTTGKLPLYLACGCPVLASHVGEAATLLGPLGWTVRYDGTVDRAYPSRLAAEIRRWSADLDGQAARRQTALKLAQAFDVNQARRQALGALGLVQDNTTITE